MSGKLDPAAPGFQPVQISWLEYVRAPYTLAPASGDFGDRLTPPRKLASAEALGIGYPHGGYHIHRGRFSARERTDERLLRARGFLVVATLRGQLVAACCVASLWVHPEHRGRGLAREMVVERFLHTGTGPGRDVPRSKPMQYTPAGFSAMVSAYRALVERGVVDPGPGGLP